MIICAWCNQPMREEDGIDSHGICEACIWKHFPQVVRAREERKESESEWKKWGCSKTGTIYR